MKEKIIKLRKMIPIPLGEAMNLLKEHEGDIPKCVDVYKDVCLCVIMEATGCQRELAETYYSREKYDLNRAISFVNDELYDRSYQPIDGLSMDGLEKVAQWINFVQSKDFATSMTYLYIDDVAHTLSLIPVFQGLAYVLSDAIRVYNRIFEGYTDAMPLAEFVKRCRRLDDEPAFVQAYNEIPLRMVVIKEELQRHGRNINNQ